MFETTKGVWKPSEDWFGTQRQEEPTDASPPVTPGPAMLDDHVQEIEIEEEDLARIDTDTSEDEREDPK